MLRSLVGSEMCIRDSSGADEGTTTGITHIMLNEALDSDDILTVHYVRKT